MAKPVIDQENECLRFANSGHNLLITGQAGAGISTVINSIRQNYRQGGLKVALVCSSGIACKVSKRGVTETIAADMPSKQLIALFTVPGAILD